MSSVSFQACRSATPPTLLYCRWRYVNKIIIIPLDGDLSAARIDDHQLEKKEKKNTQAYSNLGGIDSWWHVRKAGRQW